MLKLDVNAIEHYTQINFRYGSQPGGEIRVQIEQKWDPRNAVWDLPYLSWSASSSFTAGTGHAEIQSQLLLWAIEITDILKIRTDTSDMRRSELNFRLDKDTWDHITADKNLEEKLEILLKLN